MILLEAHQGLWSQLSPEASANGTEESRHLTLAGFLQQVKLLPIQALTHVARIGALKSCRDQPSHESVVCSACRQLVPLQVLVFINTFLSLSDANQVAVIGMTSTTR